MITSMQKAEGRRQKSAIRFSIFVLPAAFRPPRSRAFTLLETMVAITLLTVAIVAPMALTTQSLASAYYARDQITASYLAQEAIEAVRSVRDGNVLKISQGINVDLLDGFPSVTGLPFRIDTRDNVTGNKGMTLCSSDPGGVCIPLQIVGNFYGYSAGSQNSKFMRTVTAVFVGGNPNEIKITATVEWQTAGKQKRTFIISENLFRWVADGSGV
jgi:type II secretory pathway pseudopilin PulG